MPVAVASTSIPTMSILARTATRAPVSAKMKAPARSRATSNLPNRPSMRVYADPGLSLVIVVLHPPGGPDGGGLATEPCYHIQTHVDTGRDAGRGHDVPRVDVALTFHHRHRRVLLSHPVDAAPVRGRSPAVEDAALGQQEGAGADAGRQLGPAVLRRDPVEQPRVETFSSSPLSARHDDDVKRRVILNRRVRLEQQTAPSGDRAPLLGDRDDVEEPRLVGRLTGGTGRGEDLEWPAGVQHLNIVEDQDPHHASSLLAHCSLSSPQHPMRQGIIASRQSRPAVPYYNGRWSRSHPTPAGGSTPRQAGRRTGADLHSQEATTSSSTYPRPAGMAGRLALCPAYRAAPLLCAT